MSAVLFYVGAVLVSKLSLTSLKVSGREEPVSETAKVYQTEVVRGSFIHGSWKGDPQTGADIWWDNAQKKWQTFKEGDPTIYENTECAISSEERDIMFELWESAGGKPQQGKQGWLHVWDPLKWPCPCIFGWKGVKCDREGRISEINLAYNRLEGSLPESLNRLESLRVLKVNSNKLRGKFPDLKMNSLEILYAHNNQFSQFPTGISYLENLHTFFVDGDVSWTEINDGG